MKAYLLLLLTFCYCNYSSGFANKSVYLIDSLDLSALENEDIVLLDSTMLLISNTKEGNLFRFSRIIDLIDNLNDYKTSERYNDLLLESVPKLINKGIPSTQKKEYLEILSVAFSNKGHFASANGQISLAIESYKKAILIQKSTNNLSYMGLSYLNLGGTYYQIGETDQALEYFEIARSLFKTSTDCEYELMITLNNIAVVYEAKKQHELSLELQHELLELCSVNNFEMNRGIAHNNIGGILTLKEKNEEALFHLLEAVRIFKNLNNIRWLTLTYTKLGTLYIKKGDTKKAFEIALEAEKLANTSSLLESKMYSSRLLYNLYKETGDHNKALTHYENYIQIKDSLSGESAKITAVQKELQYKFEQEQLLTQNEVNRKLDIANLEKERKKLIYNSTLVVLIIFVLFVILLFYRMRLISKQKKVIEKQSEERKLLLKEIHHRVKNNFQIVTSILKLQSYNTDNEIVNLAFQDAISRIHSMSAIHEMIYRQENFSEIKPQDYFIKLTNSMQGYSTNSKLTFDVKSNIDYLNVETLVPLGIAVNELITNSIKYAFPEEDRIPKIVIALEEIEGTKTLIYKDNGIGSTYKDQKETFGMELISTIIDQIDGEIKDIELDGWNTCLKISFV